MLVVNPLTVMQDGPVIPVIVLNDAAQAIPLARALLAGGVRVLEITLRTPAALEAISLIAREVPEALVGAGTVCSATDALAACQAGAMFAVSPGYTPALGHACRDLGLPLLPGVSTASEIMLAQDDGHTELKFFPAVQSGGLAMLKALGGPFPHIRFCPTGGITSANAPDFLALPNVVCIGGSWLIPQDALESGDYDRIERLAREASVLKAR